MAEDFTRKMDALDLVITALMAHEKRLSKVADRLEKAFPKEY